MTVSKLKMPDSVKVGWKTIRIEEWTAEQADDTDLYGQYKSGQARISVAGCYGRRQAAQTLLHEILHAIHDIFKRPDEADEEHTVSIFASGLSTVWRDNPRVIEWIDEALTDG